MNEPTIDELIASFSVTDAGKSVVGKAILASLEKLAALEKPVPVEPFRRFRGVLKPVDRGMWVNGPCDYYHDAEVDTRIDSLQSALQRAQEERDKWMSLAQANQKLAETAHRRANREQRFKEQAESINRRMVEKYRDLVVAAEAAYIAGPENHELADALAKLEEA